MSVLTTSIAGDATLPSSLKMRHEIYYIECIWTELCVDVAPCPEKLLLSLLLLLLLPVLAPPLTPFLCSYPKASTFLFVVWEEFSLSYLFAQFNSSFPSPLSLICRIRHPHDPTPLPCHGSTVLPVLQSSSPTCPQVLPSVPRLSCLSAPYFSLLVLSQPLSFILSTADFL